MSATTARGHREFVVHFIVQIGRRAVFSFRVVRFKYIFYTHF
jgi:hypothetical protein